MEHSKYEALLSFLSFSLNLNTFTYCSLSQRNLKNFYILCAEFLETNFPNYDLSVHGKDWKTCITNVNAMIRCLRSETKTNPVSCPEVIIYLLNLCFLLR